MDLLKREIQRRPRFDLSAAFDVVMRWNPIKNENCITPAEFKQILKSHGVFTLDRDIASLFNRFDKNADGKMNYKDFASEMLTVE